MRQEVYSATQLKNLAKDCEKSRCPVCRQKIKVIDYGIEVTRTVTRLVTEISCGCGVKEHTCVL